jgi:hypothetical protein
MSKEKKGPEVTADDALSGEHDVMVDEVRQVFTETGRNDMGVGKISVMPLPGHQVAGGPPRAPGVPTVSEYQRAQGEKAAELRSEAEALVTPGIEIWKDAPTCSYFTHRSGNGAYLGQPVWCTGSTCPSWTEGACAMNALGSMPMLAKRIQPKDRAEFETMIRQPGARMAADTEARVQAEIARLQAVRAEAARASRAEQEARDTEIMRLRREERAKPSIRVVRPGEDISAVRAQQRRSVMER